MGIPGKKSTVFGRLDLRLLELLEYLHGAVFRRAASPACRSKLLAGRRIDCIVAMDALGRTERHGEGIEEGS